ncbi:MAG: monooxygenase [Sulfobacillus benefaciens]|uniref:Monooxygenase n=1 Tax=Sulfobacillus benefaciens TaxID=453960 RepID=A0A2T2XJS7_9FIRM|nr:MAG: monooxygenase [Sulfobacillus benefaciens]
MSVIRDKLEAIVSHKCGVTMNDSVEGRLVAEVMSQKPGVTITYYPAMIRIDMNELSEAFGQEMTPALFEVETSTHYGRMVRFDDKIVIYGNLEEALQFEE